MSPSSISHGLTLDRLWRRRSSFGAQRSRAHASTFLESLAIGSLAALAYFGLVELAVRTAIHAPLLEDRDFRHDRAARNVNQAVEYDSLLGWRLKPFIATKGFNTIEYGFRSNGETGAAAKQGGVLAVGSSFTAGSEVADEETWPAHLEQLTGWPVNNAGQGGYQADQIMLLAEQLIPIIHPQVIVVDLIPDNIVGNGYSSYGWWKPYFTIDNGELVHHNLPVPLMSDPGRDRLGIKPFLGHFAAVDQFMTAFFSDSWFSSDGVRFVTVKTDEVQVTCRLLERLKHQADAAGIQLILYLQFAGSHITAAPAEAVQSLGVKQCGQQLGVLTIDEYGNLKALYDRDPDMFRKYYMREQDGSTGHKSNLGNLEVAELVAAAIQQSGAAIGQKSK